MPFSTEQALQLRLRLSTNAESLSEEASTLYQNYLDHYSLTKADYFFAIKHREFTLATQVWTYPDNLKTLFIVHGFLDHMGLYQRAVQWGLREGFNVVIFDLPGHGLSSGAQASIDSFNQYSEALLCVIGHSTQLGLSSQHYSLTQSTGCAVLSNALLFLNAPLFEHSIMLAPLIRSCQWPQQRWRYHLLKYFKKQVKRRFSICSHDEDFVNFIKQQDQLQSKTIPLPWLGAMDQWIIKMKQNAKCDQALTLIQGTGDTTVDWRYNIPIMQAAFPMHQTHFIEDGFHHLVNESPNYWQTIDVLMTQAVSEPSSL